MNERQLGPSDFEAIVADLLEREGFDVTTVAAPGQPDHGADLLAVQNDVQSVVQVKFYRSRRISLYDLFPAAQSLATARRKFNTQYALLFTSARINEGSLIGIDGISDIVAIGYDQLGILLHSYPDLLVRFRELVRSAALFSSPGEDAFEPQAFPLRDLKRFAEAPREAPGLAYAFVSPAEEEEPTGKRLCRELKAIRPAPKGASKALRNQRAKQFEEKCIECLRFLFKDNFAGDDDQHTTHNSLSRFDYITRLNPASTFWRVMLEDFRSRYVVFEFKLYSESISQGEILTTEKYLYRTALRSVSIIISPKGFSKNAEETARGALREHGKLILGITVEHVCKMLLRREGLADDQLGEDVDLELLLTLDKMLMGIER